MKQLGRAYWRRLLPSQSGKEVLPCDKLSDVRNVGFTGRGAILSDILVYSVVSYAIAQCCDVFQR